MNPTTYPKIQVPTAAQVIAWTASCWALSVVMTILVGGV